MCLAASHSEVKKADHDIVCYKMLIKQSLMGATYRTPYMNYPVHERYTSGESDFSAHRLNPETSKPSIINGRKRYMYRVAEGFIHSYANPRSAKRIALNHFHLFGFNGDVFKCIIPKGAEYYEGVDSTKCKSYASSKIRFIKKI